MRPFDEDDDDLELNYFLDRHLQIAMATVDELYRLDVPMEIGDPLAGKNGSLLILPHTKMSATQPQHPPKLHTIVDTNDLDKSVVLYGIPMRKLKPSRPF